MGSKEKSRVKNYVKVHIKYVPQISFFKLLHFQLKSRITHYANNNNG